MPDWAVVLIAAFGGGLAGAVLQPLASHILERLRREEETRKKRERHLRRMLVAQIRLGRGAVAMTTYAKARLQQRQAVSVEELQASLTPAPGGPLWEPQRIPDPQLREDAIKYDDTRAKLDDLLWHQPIDFGRAFPLAQQLESLQVEITHRMDELNWPEVDD